MGLPTPAQDREWLQMLASQPTRTRNAYLVGALAFLMLLVPLASGSVPFTSDLIDGGKTYDFLDSYLVIAYSKTKVWVQEDRIQG